MEFIGTITDGVTIQEVIITVENNFEYLTGLILGAITALTFWHILKDAF